MLIKVKYFLKLLINNQFQIISLSDIYTIKMLFLQDAETYFRKRKG